MAEDLRIRTMDVSGYGATEQGGFMNSGAPHVALLLPANAIAPTFAVIATDPASAPLPPPSMGTAPASNLYLPAMGTAPEPQAQPSVCPVPISTCPTHASKELASTSVTSQPVDVNAVVTQTFNPLAGMNPALDPFSYQPIEAQPLLDPVIESPVSSNVGRDIVPGYEALADSDGIGFLPPPPGLVPVPPVSSPADTNWTIPSITEAIASQAFLKFAESTCCYGTAPAKDMNIQNITPFYTYRYRLETFTELRSCDWVDALYTGQFVDSSVYGIAPQLWDIPIQVPTVFIDNVHKIPIPHTSSLKSCPQCKGVGRRICTTCHGIGRVKCWICNGTGRQMQMGMCQNCFGTGMQTCRFCTNSQNLVCTRCSGKGQLLNYLQLTVSWKNNIFEFVANHKSQFPTNLFKKVDGEKIFVDEQLLVPPIMNFPEASINQASQNALQQHHTQFFSSSRVLRQRHSIELLPLTLVDYSWKGEDYNYFVYGKENKVYTSNYPADCCCCCAVM